PQLRSIRGVNQLGNDPHLVPLLSHGAFEERAYTELLADRFGFLFPVFETKGRAAANYLKISDLTQSCDQFFRQSVGKIFIARIAAFVKQWQDRDRFFWNDPGGLAVLRCCISSSITAEKKETERQRCGGQYYYNPSS